MVQKRGKRGNLSLKLFKLVERAEWTEAAQFCKEHPTEATKWVIKRDPDGGVEWKHLPLHKACINQPTLEVIETLLVAFPESPKVHDHMGRLPMHLACKHGAPISVIRKLLLVGPEAVHISDDVGKTPLAYAREGGGFDAEAAVELISAQLKIDEEKEKDKVFLSESRDEDFGHLEDRSLDLKGGHEKQSKADEPREATSNESGREEDQATKQPVGGNDTGDSGLSADVAQDNEPESDNPPEAGFSESEDEYELELIANELEKELATEMMKKGYSEIFSENEVGTLKKKVELLKSKLVDLSFSNKQLEEKVDGFRAEAEQTKSHLIDIQDTIAMHEARAEHLNQQAVDGAMNNAEKEMKFNTAVSEAVKQDDELAAKERHILTLEEEVMERKEKLALAYVRSNDVEADFERVRTAIEKAKETLSKELEKEKRLKCQVKVLEVKLIEEEEELSTVKFAYAEETEKMSLELSALNQEVAELRESKEQLEKFVRDAPNTVSCISQKAEDTYISNTRRIEELKQELAISTHRRNVESERNNEEKGQIIARYKSLEKTNNFLEGTLRAEKEAALKQLKGLEVQLKKAADAQADAVMQSYFREKRSL